MTDPRVTVLLTVFNARPYVAEAVVSILRQTFSDLTCLCIDDGSNDGSGRVLDDLARSDARIRVIHQANQGRVAALNRGLAEATSELIALMDADDVALPDRLEKQVAFLDRHPHVAAVGGAAEVFSDAGPTGAVMWPPTAPADIRAAVDRYCPMVNSAATFRRLVVVAAGGYRRAFFDAEDYDLWMRLARSHDLANLPEIVVRYRVHPGQVSSRNICQQALSRLGVRQADVLRQVAGTDPGDHVDRVTVDVLRQWNVPDAAIERELFDSVNGVFESLLRRGLIEEARRVIEARDQVWPSGSRWARGQRAWHEAKLRLAGGQRTAALPPLLRAWALDPSLFLRTLRALRRAR